MAVWSGMCCLTGSNWGNQPPIQNKSEIEKSIKKILSSQKGLWCYRGMRQIYNIDLWNEISGFIWPALERLSGVGIVSSYLSYGKIVVKPNVAPSAGSGLPTATTDPGSISPYSILLLGYGGGATRADCWPIRWWWSKSTQEIRKYRWFPSRDLWCQFHFCNDGGKL